MAESQADQKIGDPQEHTKTHLCAAGDKIALGSDTVDQAAGMAQARIKIVDI